MSPLPIALLAGPLLGEPLRARQWLRILLGLTGVLLVVSPLAAHSHAELAAILLGLLGVVGLAGGSFYCGARRTRGSSPPSGPSSSYQRT